MFRAGCKFALLSAAAVAAAGCGSPAAPIELDTRGVTAAVDYEALGRVLAEVVDDEGRLDIDALTDTAETLEEQLKLLAVTGPTVTPQLLAGDEEKLAYWYNARAAWSLRLLLAADPPDVDRIAEADVNARPFPLDGRTMTLADLDDILAEDADFRAVAAAPGVTAVHARMPERPFTPGGLRRQIAVRLSDLIDDETRFVIDIRRQRILVPPVLWRFREKLIESHQRRYGVERATLATALLEYVEGSPHRRLQDAIGYEAVEAIPRRLAAAEKSN